MKRRGKKRAASARPSMRERLREAEETLEAIRMGHVDALVVNGPEGDQVFTLKGADRRYRQLVETMNQGALMIGTEGTIVYANARFAQMVGGRLEKLISSRLGDYVAEGSRALVDALLASRGDAEAELVASNGTSLPVYLSATTGWDEDLAVTCVIVTDLSEQKRNQAALAASANAEAANRAKDEFLAMLGHELRNPLAPILTALELMELRSDGSSRRERDVIDRHVKQVVRLVGDLLDVSRITQGKLDLERMPVDLERVIAKAIEAASPLIEERRHELVVEVPAGIWLDADETRICQVISNLLTNATKYTEVGGRIEIRARRDGNDAVIVVRDNGMGIPPEILPHLFDLFVQGKRTIERSEGGLGLGLSIVRSLVALHGGTVDIRSEGVGRGSEFEIRLPTLASTPRELAPAVEPPVITEHKRVLVVDDNIDAADLLAEGLQMIGHETRTAYDGPSAIDIAAEFDPEIAVLDIGLPVMDGYELARRLRDRTPPSHPLRLIALTGYGSATDPQTHARGRLRQPPGQADRHRLARVDDQTLLREPVARVERRVPAHSWRPTRLAETATDLRSRE